MRKVAGNSVGAGSVRCELPHRTVARPTGIGADDPPWRGLKPVRYNEPHKMSTALE